MMYYSNAFLNLIIAAIAYLLGSFPSGYLAGRLIKGIDLRKIGSGSTGATNVLRHVGKKAALIVFLLDVSKGMFAVLIAKSFMLSESWQVVIGLAALAGHIWPIWLDWKGGKAVATGLGLFLGISWQVGLACLGIFILTLSVFKIVSFSSVIAAISLPLLMQITINSDSIFEPYIFISLASMVLVLWRHRSNIKRLMKGTEPKLGDNKLP